jgi:streptomycin 6-kinase
VAVDPAPCCGDPAFDTVDLLMWQVDGLAALGTRAEELAALVGLPARRLLRWCAAFAAMNALELAEGVARDRPLPDRVGMLLELSRAS